MYFIGNANKRSTELKSLVMCAMDREVRNCLLIKYIPILSKSRFQESPSFDSVYFYALLLENGIYFVVKQHGLALAVIFFGGT